MTNTCSGVWYNTNLSDWGERHLQCAFEWRQVSYSMNLITYKSMCVEFETTNGKKIIENISFQKQVFLCITLGRREKEGGY